MTTIVTITTEYSYFANNCNYNTRCREVGLVAMPMMVESHFCGSILFVVTMWHRERTSNPKHAGTMGERI